MMRGTLKFPFLQSMIGQGPTCLQCPEGFTCGTLDLILHLLQQRSSTNGHFLFHVQRTVFQSVDVSLSKTLNPELLPVAASTLYQWVSKI